MHATRGGSSHCTFRKAGCRPITIPRYEPIKRVYIEMVKQIVENEVNNEVRSVTEKPEDAYMSVSQKT